jgi:hypothetical protein
VRSRRHRLAIAASSVLAASTLVTTARADLEADAERLAAHWKAAGFEVDHRPAMFLENGRLRLLPMTPSDLGGDCVTVALLGHRGSDFAVRTEIAGAAGLLRTRPRPVERALAGLHTLSRCGPARVELLHAALEMRAARGAVEMRVAKGPAPAPSPTRPARRRCWSSAP